MFMVLEQNVFLWGALVTIFFFFDIIILTETCLSSFYHFTILRLDRNANNNFHSRSGGVLIVVKSMIFSSLSIPFCFNVKDAFALFSINNSILLIIFSYLSPTSSIAVIVSYLLVIDRFPAAHKPDTNLFISDYSLPSVSWSTDRFGISAFVFLSPATAFIIDNLIIRTLHF